MTCQPGQHPRLREGRLLGCLWVAQLSRTTWIGLLAATWGSDAAADHGGVERAERGEQGSGAVTLVVVRHSLATRGLDRQPGLGAVERLDLALFRRARAPRRGPADRHRARRCRPAWRQSWDRERLKGRSRCGCSLCARQMRCTEPSEIPMALAIARPVQRVAWCGSVPDLPPRRRGAAPLPAPWLPPPAAPCRACGACRPADTRPPSRHSAVATATPSAG